MLEKKSLADSGIQLWVGRLAERQGIRTDKDCVGSRTLRRSSTANTGNHTQELDIIPGHARKAVKSLVSETNNSDSGLLHRSSLEWGKGDFTVFFV